MSTIVTHHTPDLDAITSAWLIKKFLPNWQEARIRFVPAGQTLNGETVDSDPKVLHVDTGFGKLDHHQTGEFTCAAQLTYRYIKKNIDKTGKWSDEALERMADVVCFYDHFRDAKLKDATADYHAFSIVAILDGLAVIYPDQDHKLIDVGFEMLDAIYKHMQSKIWAEDIIENESVKFRTKWGEAIAFETINDDVLEHSQKMGYVVALRKDPKKGYVRIKGTPGSGVDFTEVYETLKQKDPQATWFLHVSKKILLNGTTKNPDMLPTRLSLNEIIEVLKLS